MVVLEDDADFARQILALAGQSGFASGYYRLIQRHSAHALTLASTTQANWDFEVTSTFYRMDRDEQRLPWPRQPAAVQQMLADYYRYISFLDQQIGRVLDAVDASPEAANTFGLSDRSGTWQFMLLLSRVRDSLPTPDLSASDSELMSWLRDLFRIHFASAHEKLNSTDS